ncbi:ornithine decarboxylase 2-like [Calliopsis andreniformis]|uniref:ornithine decarboxylase 2-like n=1 Tax=Calliopsis andreniformis TaxID=337506 RepID=UPI003FCDA039
MSHFNFDDVKLYDNTLSDCDIIKAIIKTQDDEDSFCILDVAELVRRHTDWTTKMPRVLPHYAVKCNPDPTIIKVLAALNAGFDCASKEEIRIVMKHGVSADRIVFANPAKCPSHIKFARKMNVEKTTVDCEAELMKIKEFYPKAKVIIRIRSDAKLAGVPLGIKFGCEPEEKAVRLIQLTKSLGLTLYGFSFHVGSPCLEVAAYSRAIGLCKKLIGVAKSYGCKDVQVIDIGGGFNGYSGYQIDEIASIVNDAIEDVDPSIQIISEPGQYYVTSAFTLASYLHTKKIILDKGDLVRMYYMNCGVYTSFVDELLRYKSRMPVPLSKPTSDETFLSYLWGPTCDSRDCIVKNVMLPEYEVGDWLTWKDMGAYTLSITSTFNGFQIPKVYPFLRKGHWESVSEYINAMKKSQKSIS